LLVEDLGSTNGTFVNGTAIREPVALSVGDTIRLGSSELSVVGAPTGEPRSLAAAHSRLHESRTRMSLAASSDTATTGGFVLLVEEGNASGKRIPVEEELIVGRAEQGVGRLDGDPELSRRHASFSLFDPGRVLVEDLGSTNGTFVNGHRIHAPTIVTPGDEIRVGSTTLDVEPPTSRPTTTPAEPPVPAGEPS
jgi:pSer/pThr/pTyr-binding forkhead associated (FHA) protein